MTTDHIAKQLQLYQPMTIAQLTHAAISHVSIAPTRRVDIYASVHTMTTGHTTAMEVNKRKTN